MQDVAIWIGVAVGIITALGVLGAGVVWCSRMLWTGATLVSKIETTNANVAEVGRQITNELQGVKAEISKHGQRLDQHELKIAMLTILHGKNLEDAKWHDTTGDG